MRRWLRGLRMHEKTLSSRTIFTGRILRLETQEVELADGRRAYREIVRHHGAVCVLLRGPDGRFVLIRQYRKAVEKILMEVVAGILEPGEEPDACARREVKEETGFDTVSLRRMGTLFPTPGYVDERIACYYAEAGEERTGHDLDADEHLEVVMLDEVELAEKIRQGHVEDAKTLAAWALYREGAGR